jgi:rubrerythrin
MSPLKTYQSRIAYLLTQQELLVAELYRFFAGLFPEYRTFWDNLAREEMEHATWVEYFYKKASTDTVRFEEGKVKTYTVESFVKYLGENLAKVKDKAPTLQAAFSLALNIENSLIVRRVFDFFLSSDPEILSILKDLRSKLFEHRRRLEQAAAKATAQETRKP